MSAKATIARLAAAAALVCATVGGTATGTASAATTAYPTTPVSMVYTATYFQGTITWYNRGVSVDGTLKGISGSCRRLYVKTFSSQPGDVLGLRSTSTVCGGPTPEHISVPADVVGGAYRVEIDFTDANASVIIHANCFRDGCAYRQW